MSLRSDGLTQRAKGTVFALQHGAGRSPAAAQKGRPTKTDSLEGQPPWGGRSEGLAADAEAGGAGDFEEYPGGD